MSTAEAIKLRLNIILESLLSAVDIGALFESITHYRKRSWKVDPKVIIKHLIKGKGFTNLTPPHVSELFSDDEGKVEIVDLRDTEMYAKGHIKGSISKPIDDFLKEVFEQTYPSMPRNRKIIAVCATGKLSKVAAAVLAEEGHAHVYSISGGMRRWNRWMNISRNMFLTKISACCSQMT